MSDRPLTLLTHLYRDQEMCQIFSEHAAVTGWLRAEVALAQAQANVGVLTRRDADDIARAAHVEHIDLPALWDAARTVGYPIFDLVRALNTRIQKAGGNPGHAHLGATTQDIMDTGLALQLADAIRLLDERIGAFGEGLAAQVSSHTRLVMPARTHAQQAVPTTFGAVLAPLLVELARHRDRLTQARDRICMVSAFGAGGTSAAQGDTATAVRTDMAAQLHLVDTTVPWHTARDGIAEFGWLCATTAATCARFARMVIDLSRTEIDEIREPSGHHRGASSTMPQKANPISSEAIIGMSATASALSSALTRIQEAGHERAAGEWQIEWETIPQLAVLASSSLKLAADTARDLVVHPGNMKHNLAHDGGLIMSEAWMMALAPTLGREKAHDLVYAAAHRVRNHTQTLPQAVHQLTTEQGLEFPIQHIEPGDYLGDTDTICHSALQAWKAS